MSFIRALSQTKVWTTNSNKLFKVLSINYKTTKHRLSVQQIRYSSGICSQFNRKSYVFNFFIHFFELFVNQIVVTAINTNGFHQTTTRKQEPLVFPNMQRRRSEMSFMSNCLMSAMNSPKMVYLIGLVDSLNINV